MVIRAFKAAAIRIAERSGRPWRRPDAVVEEIVELIRKVAVGAHVVDLGVARLLTRNRMSARIFRLTALAQARTACRHSRETKVTDIHRMNLMSGDEADRAHISFVS
jgi:hypothetical protein